MVDVTPPTPPSSTVTSNKRARDAGAMNELRPSPAIVSWIGRAVQRITSESPWIYQADLPISSRTEARRWPESEPEPQAFVPRAATSPLIAPQPDSGRRPAPLDTRSVPEDVRE